MSHGSKKWIKDYRGRIKRSRNRTKYDRIVGAKYHPHAEPSFYPFNDEKPKCPQCRHVWKQFEHDADEYYRIRKELYAEFEAKYKNSRSCVTIDGKTVWIWEYFRNHPKYPGHLWHYHSNTFLCFRCEERERAMSNHWHDHHGMKKNYGYRVRRERREYRARTKHLMRNERYEDIVPPKHGWLD